MNVPRREKIAWYSLNAWRSVSGSRASATSDRPGRSASSADGAAPTISTSVGYKSTSMAFVRTTRPPSVGPCDRQRQFVLVIEAEVRIRNDEREVWRHEADEEHPRLATTGRIGFLTEPPRCRL